MASGKKSKERRRAAAAAPPPVRSRGRPPPEPRRQASPRVLLVAAGVVVAIGVVVAAIVASRAARRAAAANIPTTGSLTNALRCPAPPTSRRCTRGSRSRGTTLGEAEGARDDDRVHRPAVPVLPAVRDADAARAPQELRPPRQAADRDAAVGVPRARLDHAASTRRSRRASRTRGSTSAVLYANQGTENTGWLNETMVTSAAASVPGLNVPKLLADQDSARSR